MEIIKLMKLLKHPLKSFVYLNYGNLTRGIPIMGIDIVETIDKIFEVHNSSNSHGHGHTLIDIDLKFCSVLVPHESY